MKKGLACLAYFQKYIRRKNLCFLMRFIIFLIAFYYYRVLNSALITNSLKLVPVYNTVLLEYFAGEKPLQMSQIS